MRKADKMEALGHGTIPKPEAGFGWSRARWLALVAVVALAQTVLARDSASYCNAVQNKTGFLRYPLGRIGAWSTVSGEAADVMTRVPRLYPCVNTVAVKAEKEDWRASITGDPSVLDIVYRTNSPAGGCAMAITVSPHVSFFKVTFPEPSRSNCLVLDFSKGTVDTWARLNKWTERKVTRVDERTFEATVGEAGQRSAFYILKFDVPCSTSGSIDSLGNIKDGMADVPGSAPRVYAQFDAKTITVSVAESFVSLKQAGDFLAAESAGFDSVRQKCLSAWNKVLSRVELEGAENSKRMAYTALYSLYANIIDGGDGSCYAKNYARPRSVASSAYWQFIGGYQSCCWDNVRATYPFLSLAYPEVMTDVLGTYLARYERDGCLDGDICLITGPSGHKNIRFVPVVVEQAYQSGVEADYAKLYAALKDNFSNDIYFPPTLNSLGYMTQPAEGGFACSRTLEFTTGLHSMALLANANHDPEGAQRYARLSQAYTNLWDSANKCFRLKNPDGSWGALENSKMTWNPNPQGLFEGTTKDWMFGVPHDPYGLMALPGQENFAERVSQYCLNECWFNDYQTMYPFLLYYAGAANKGEEIMRRSWVPMFASGVMYEGVRPRLPHNGWQTHYTGNSGWLICSMLGLYPSASPPGQFIISSPSVTRAAIRRGNREIAVRAQNNNDENIFIRSIKLDGKPYPCYMIPAKRLAAGAALELEMSSDPAQGLGDLYIGSSDGFVGQADLVSASKLKCVIESAIGGATTKIYSRAKPLRVTVNGYEDKTYGYDEADKTLTIRSAGTATIEVFVKL